MKVMKGLLMLLLTIVALTVIPVVAATGTYDSSPTAHTASGVTDPQLAYDGDLNSYPSDFSSGSTDYLYVHTFSISGAPIGSPITSVDFKMKWSEAGGAPTKEYRILCQVSPSATEVVLVDWTAADKAVSTDTWANKPEPGDGSWSWTDVTHIQFMVESRSTGGGGHGTINEYEAWVTVHYTTAPGVPEFPFGYAVELALIPTVLYMLWKAKGTSTRLSRLARS